MGKTVDPLGERLCREYAVLKTNNVVPDNFSSRQHCCRSLSSCRSQMTGLTEVTTDTIDRNQQPVPVGSVGCRRSGGRVMPRSRYITDQRGPRTRERCTMAQTYVSTSSITFPRSRPSLGQRIHFFVQLQDCYGQDLLLQLCFLMGLRSIGL